MSSAEAIMETSPRSTSSNEAEGHGKRKRIYYFDAAKFILMIMIVAGHTRYQKPDFVSPLVYSVHVAAFYIISGYFLKPCSTDTTAYLKKIMKTYVLPYVITCCLMICIASFKAAGVGEWLPVAQDWLNASLYGSGGRTDFAYWPTEPKVIGAIWFLLALAWANLFLHLISKFAKQTEHPVQTELICISVLAYVGYYTAKVCWLPLSIQAGMTATAFLYVGMLAKRAGLFVHFDLPVWMRILMAGIWTYCVMFYGRMYLVDNTFHNGLMDFIGSVCGTYTILAVCRFADTHASFVIRPLAFMGRFTLPMLCVHILELNMLNYWAVLLPWVQSFGVTLTYGIVLTVRMLVVLVGTALICMVPMINRGFGVKPDPLKPPRHHRA